MVNNKKPDIILLTETWLNNHILDSTIHIPNYSVIRQDRAGRRGGGACIYVKDNIHGIKTLVVQRDSPLKNNEMESVWITLRLNSFELMICTLYRPNTCSPEADAELCAVLSQFSEIYSQDAVIFGDFNHPDIDWANMVKLGTNPATDQFFATYCDSHFHQLITQPTRYRDGVRPSLLDLILATDENLIVEVNLECPLGKSDHVVIEATAQVHLYPKAPNAIKHPNYWAANYTQIKAAINETHFEENLPKYANWLALTGYINDHFIPKMKPKKMYNKPWIKKNLIKKINMKRKLWHRFRQTRNTVDETNYKNLKNEICNELKRERQIYERGILEGGHKNFYKYINTMLSSKVTTFVLRDGESITTDPDRVANIFAGHFQSVFTAEPPGDLPTLPPGSVSLSSINSILFTREKVLNAINQLKMESAPGPDLVSPVLLKRCAKELVNILVDVMNEAITNSEVPREWKEAIVIPIYKKGSKLDPSNYRPISLTSVPCKIMEKIITREITNFLLQNHRPLFNNQHGFLPQKSVTTNLLYNLNKWTEALDNGYPIDVVYLDFQKAFDTVPLQRLLYKLHHIGIRGNLLEWIRNYLTGRTFQVRIEGQCSSRRPVTSGVPQGSVLGPLLFLIYISDISTDMICNVSLFADDTKIFCDPSINHGGLMEDLATLKTWTDKWLIKLNVSKCSVLHIGGSNPQLRYFIGNTELKAVERQNDLGITMTSDLKWAEHVNRVVKKVNSIVYLLKRSFRYITKETFLIIYKTYIRPVLEFAAAVWCPYFVKDIDLLERAQRRATKLPQCLRGKTYEERLEQLGLTTLIARRQRGDLIETFKIMQHYYDADLSFFVRSHDNRLRGHSLKLTTERCNRLCRKNFLSNRVVSAWNNLPENVVTATSVNSFKNQLDRFQ